MKKMLFTLIFVFCLSATLQIGVSVAFSAGPVLFFSDLTWGPKTGWEGSTTRGAAVTVWGKNFGSTRGSSCITVNGAQIAEYAEWGAIGPARALERITFWLNSSCTDGDGTITVTVNGVTSNALNFTVVAGTAAKIYFISVSNGSNGNNGLYSTSQGGSNGPWKDIYMFNPGLDSYSYGHNPSGDGQYIVYARQGTYTAVDTDGAFVALRGPYGGPDKRKALIAYPGEIPTLNTAGASRGIIWNADYSPYGKNSYFTYSKLNGIYGVAAIGVIGNYNRVIGCTFKEYLDYAQDGVVWVTASQYTSLFGNLFDHNGNDSMKHNIYVKTQPGFPGDRNTWYTYIGWNEITNAVSSDNHGGAIFISRSSDAGSYTTQYIYIHGNYLHDGNMEFIYTGDNTDIGEIYIYNNIFRHGTCTNAGIYLAWDTLTVYLFNNLFYQIGDASAPMVGVVARKPTTATFKNNIFYSRPGQEFINVESGGATANSDHDLFYNPGGTTTPPSGVAVTSPIVGNPLFRGPTNYNFHLQTNSPAINVGTAVVSPYVAKDFDGLSRPQGSLYDIGPYEYASGGDTTPPAAPNNLKIMP